LEGEEEEEEEDIWEIRWVQTITLYELKNVPA
jgi:hypothetical protein